MLTIITAMEEELARVRTALAEYGRGQPNAGDAVPDVHVIGIGRQGVESGLPGLLPTLRQQRSGAEPPTGLLLLGFAGGVDPSLSAGDLTLASRYCRLVRQPERLVAVPVPEGMTGPEHLERLRAQLGAGPPSLPRFQLEWPSRYMNPIIPRHALLKSLEPDPAMLQHSREALAQGGLTAVETDSMTVEELITDANTKGELHRQFGVGTVNMEDYWVARLAATAKVPFLSVRAVLDTADQGVPSHLLEQARRLGRSVGQAAGWASFGGDPSDIRALLHLPGQMQLAQESLARFALAFLGCSTEYLSTNQGE